MLSTSTASMLRRFTCFNATVNSSPALTTRKKLVFLGSPQISASVLDDLLDASSVSDSQFEVAAIVTQPPSGRDRGRKVLPSPVAQRALDRGFSSDLILTPQRAGEDSFLSDMKALEADLCITAAYGNILPSKFLNIPTLGTVNIHPSLLPLYRGAAPVQRALQDGIKETGVSLAFTVRALDAGPVIAWERMEIDDEIKAPDLLEQLFSQGSKLLISELPSIFDGSARVKARPQDDSKASLAPKISQEESWLSFDEDARVLHNKVRAFAGWPGTKTRLAVMDANNNSGENKVLDLKIISTRVWGGEEHLLSGLEADNVAFIKGTLIFPCAGGTALEVVEVQVPGKKAISGAAFWNGLRGQQLKICCQEKLS